MKKFPLFIITLLVTGTLFFTLRSNTRETDHPQAPVANEEPFMLSSFEGTMKAKSRMITWSDRDERIIDQFQVQRSSSPNEGFETISVLSPKYADANSYTVRDDAAFAGNMAYYRLASVGKDGYSRFSNVIALKTDRVTQVTLYPNPALDNVSLAFGDILHRANIKFVNQQGNTVLAIPNFSGNNLMQDITKFSSGMYFVQVVNEDGSSSTSSFLKKGR